VVVSALLGFMSISGIFGRNNLSKVSAEAALPDEVFAGRSVPLRVTLRNVRKRMPVFLIRAEIGGSSVLFPFIEASGGATKYVTTAFDHRGEFVMPAIHLSSVFPFNFFVRYKHLAGKRRHVVFPELRTRGTVLESADGRRRTGERTSDKTGYESDIISIREYTHGDPLKYINWKATAKTGALKTKEFSASSVKPVIIDFDALAIKHLEDRISTAAYTIVQLFREGLPVGLKINGRMYSPGLSRAHRIAMLTELACYDSRGSRGSP